MEERKTDRFAGVVMVHGLPKGVAALSPLQAVRKRHVLVEHGGGDPTSTFDLIDARGQVTRSWRVEKLGDDWHQVELLDKHGAVEELHTVTEGGRTVDKRGGNGMRLDPNCAKYRRDLNASGQIVAERCLGDDEDPREDANGIQEYQYEVNASGYITSVKARDAYERPYPLEPGRDGQGPLRQVFVRRFERNAGGQAVEETVFDSEGEPVEDADGVFRRAWSFDEAGRITHFVHYGRDGKRTGGRDGVAEERWIFADGKLKEKGFLDSKGGPVRHADGYTRILYEADNKGRIKRETYADSEGHPVLHADLGAAILAHNYDEKGRRTQTDYLGAEGAPVNARGRGYAGLRWAFDDAGRVVETRRVTAVGTPADVAIAGWAVHKITYQASGRVAQEQYEDGQDRLVPGPDGWSLMRTSRQPAPDGSMAIDVKTEFQGADGMPSRVRGARHAKVVERMGDKERLMSRAWYDVKDEPTVATDGRVHKIEMTWTPSGRLATESYFDVNLAPVLHAVTGAHKVRITYQAEGREVKREYLGVDNKPILGAEGWAIREQLIDDMGRLVELRYSASAERPVGRKGDSAAREYRFYGIGVTLRQRSLMAVSGEPLYVHPGGYTREVFEHDDEQRVTSTAWYDAAERQVIRDDLAYSKELRLYGDDGQLSEIRYLDNTDTPLYVPGKGYSGIRYEYDAVGRLKTQTYLGPEWRPTMTPMGYAGIQTLYVGDSWTVRAESFTDPRGRPTFSREGYAAARQETDGRGRLVRTLHTDTLGNGVTDTSGAAEHVWTYAGDHLVKYRTLGSNGEPTAGYHGTTGYDRVVDAYGRVARQTAIDRNDLPAYDAETGCASVTTSRNAHGQPTRTECHDAKGQLIKGLGGWAAREHTYSDHGDVVTVALEDESGSLVVGTEGWAKEIRFYDERGYEKAKAWIGDDELPATLPEGYSGVKLSRDTFGRVIKEEYLDASGNPTVDARGIAGELRTYDTHGREVEYATFDVAGQPSARKGHSIVRHVWSGTGRLRETRYLDASGKLAVGPDGWAMWRPEYDARGHVTHNHYFDTDGLPGHSTEAYEVEAFVIDRFGRVREITYTDRARRHVNKRVGKAAYAIDKREFDRYGNKADQSYFDAQGRPTVGPEGMHRLRWSYNEQGQLQAQARYHTATRPAAAGWARQAYLYDIFGRLSTIAYQDTMGRPSAVWNGVASVRFAYRDDGTLDAMTYHDTAAQRMNAKVCYPGKYCGGKAVAEGRYVYEADNPRPIRMELFDRSGNPIKQLDCKKGQCF